MSPPGLFLALTHLELVDGSPRRGMRRGPAELILPLSLRFLQVWGVSIHAVTEHYHLAQLQRARDECPLVPHGHRSTSSAKWPDLRLLRQRGEGGALGGQFHWVKFPSSKRDTS